MEHERERLRRAGIPSVLIEPGPDVVHELGVDFMSDASLRDIVRAAFLDTGDQLRAPITRTLLYGLNDRTPPRVPPAAAAPWRASRSGQS